MTNIYESSTKSWIDPAGNDENHRRAAFFLESGECLAEEKITCSIHQHHGFKHGHMDLRVSSSIIWLQYHQELEIFQESHGHDELLKWFELYRQALGSGRLVHFASPMSVVGVVLFLVSSGIIIILVATGFILSPIIFLIHLYHLG